MINPLTIGLLVALGGLLLTVIILLAIGRRPSTESSQILEVLGKRLEQIDSLSADINNLSQIFLIPHARGGLGETLLNELLRNWLPANAYDLQHSFSNGARVDAVVKLGDFLVAIDAKFPLESVRPALERGDEGVSAEIKRAFRRHIEAIRSKYIRPEDRTLQFALMYIPSERVYYHSFVSSDTSLLEEAVHAGVVPVSPSGLFLYLQTVAYGLKGFAFSSKQRELLQTVLKLRQNIGVLKRVAQTGSSHLRNLVRSQDEVLKQIEGLDINLSQIDTSGTEEPSSRSVDSKQ